MREHENEVADLQKRIEELKKQQNEAKTNKDYRAFQEAIGKIEEAIDGNENEQLAIMEKIEELNSSKPAILDKIDFQKKQLKKKEQALNENFDALIAEIKALEQQQTDLFSGIS